MLVSIVVPVYNESKTIDRMYQSIQGQSYRNLEIIFVDNNSTDDSLKQLLAYQKIDPRVHVYQEHEQGVNPARRCGFRNSHGDAIFFADADDMIAKDGIKYLVETMKRTNADIVEGEVVPYHSEKQLSQSLCARMQQPVDKNNVQEIKNVKKIVLALWTHLYKRNLIKEDFFVNLNQYEYCIFNCYMYAVSEKKVKMKEPVYYYNLNKKGGLSSLEHTINGKDYFNACGQVWKYYADHGILSQNEEALGAICIEGLYETMKNIVALLEKERDQRHVSKVKELEQQLKELRELCKSFQFWYNPYVKNEIKMEAYPDPELRMQPYQRIYTKKNSTS